MTSPLKKNAPALAKDKAVNVDKTSRHLFQQRKEHRQPVRKRKSKVSGSKPPTTSYLNLPASDKLVIVPTGFVSTKVNQFVGSDAEGDSTSDEMLKKQKCVGIYQHAKSAGAANGSPHRAQ